MADGRSKSAAVQMKSPMKQTDVDPWVTFLNETKQEDFLNEDGSLNVEAHKEAINNSLIRNGLKEKPEGWVDPLKLGEAAATGAGEFVGEMVRLPGTTTIPKVSTEQGIGEQFTTDIQSLVPGTEERIQEIQFEVAKIEAQYKWNPSDMPDETRKRLEALQAEWKQLKE